MNAGHRPIDEAVESPDPDSTDIDASADSVPQPSAITETSKDGRLGNEGSPTPQFGNPKIHIST